MLVAALLLGGVAFLLLGGWPVADGVIQSELLSADWNEEWMRLQAGRRRADDSLNGISGLGIFGRWRLPRMPGTLSSCWR